MIVLILSSTQPAPFISIPFGWPTATLTALLHKQHPNIIPIFFHLDGLFVFLLNPFF